MFDSHHHSKFSSIDFNSKSLPNLFLDQMRNKCYLTFPEECSNQLKPIYQLILDQIPEDNNTITLINLFRLLKQWKFFVPFTLLSALYRKANKLTNNAVTSQLTLAGFHQIMHNPRLQAIYRKHPDLKLQRTQTQPQNEEQSLDNYDPFKSKTAVEETYLNNIDFQEIPSSISQLFLRFYQMLQRKEIYLKVNKQANVKDQFQLMRKLFTFSQNEEYLPYRKEPPSIIIDYFEKSDAEEWLDVFENDQLDSIVTEAKKKGKSDAQAQISSLIEQEDTLFLDEKKKKFQKLKEQPQETTFLSFFDNSDVPNRLRKVHEKMINKIKKTAKDKNVKKVNILIRNSSIDSSMLKLPQI